MVRITMPLQNSDPATVGMIRKIRKEMDALRGELFKELDERLDGIGELQDSQQELIERNRRAINRLRKEKEE